MPFSVEVDAIIIVLYILPCGANLLSVVNGHFLQLGWLYLQVCGLKLHMLAHQNNVLDVSI